MRRVPPCVAVALVLALAASIAPPLAAQERSLAQDPALDNLVHPPGTVTSLWETLGEVRRGGTGERTLLFLPGLGFGADVWTEVAERHADAFRTIAVALPGFGGTAPYPMPEGAPRYSDTPWFRSAEAALAKLLEAEAPRKVTLVAQWALGTQLALRLALDHPDRVDGVILVGGVLKAYYEGPQKMETWTLEQRARFADGMGERWFKTVTRTTWDDNNFMSYDYAIHPRRALFLWRQAAAPALPVWIRWLLEFYALDLEPELAKLAVPVLVVQPGFDDPEFLVEEGRNYMRNLCLDSWTRAREAAGSPAAPTLRFTTIPQSRLFLQYDQPEALDRTLDAFLSELDARSTAPLGAFPAELRATKSEILAARLDDAAARLAKLRATTLLSPWREARLALAESDRLYSRAFLTDGVYDGAVTKAREGLALAEQAADPALVADARSQLALMLYAKDFGSADFAESRALLAGAIATYRELHDHRGLAEALFYLGLTHENCAQPTDADKARAQELYTEALAEAKGHGHRYEQSYAERHLAGLAEERGDLPTARAGFERSLALRREVGATLFVPSALLTLGDVLAAQGETAKAREIHAEALAVARSIGGIRQAKRAEEALAGLGKAN